MRISHKLLLAMFFATLLAIGATSIAAIYVASESLEKSYKEKLSAISDGRRNQLETYFKGLNTEFSNLAKDKTILGALNMLGLGITELKPDPSAILQDLLNIERSDAELANFHNENKTIRYYMQYGNFNPILKQFAKNNGLNDLYLINAEGLVVYSVLSNSEIGSNLNEQNSNHLSDAFKLISSNPESSTAFITEFDNYGLNDGKPTSFIGVPLLANGTVLGALVGQLPVNNIAEILNNTTGLGRTGETLLINRDGFLLSESQKTDSADTLSTRLNLPQTMPESRQTVVDDILGYSAQNALIAISNLDISSVNWMVAAKVDRNEVMAGTWDMTKWILILAAIALICVLCFAYWFANSLSNPINAVIEKMKQLSTGQTEFELIGLSRRDEVGDIVRAVDIFRKAAIDKTQLENEARSSREENEQQRVARENASKEQSEKIELAVQDVAHGLERLAAGDLSISLDKAFMEDLEPIRHNFNNSILKLRETLTQINRVSDEIRMDAGEISAANENLSSRTETQAASLEEAAAALSELTSNVRNASEHSTKTAKLAQNAKHNTDKSSSVVASAMSAMTRIETASEGIKGIINVIDEIAFQTNLLALNAGVEAARAGDAGKGFAVVAQEVRELAGRSADAAKEIKHLIESSSNEVNDGVNLVKETGVVLEEISGQVSTIESRITDVAQSAVDQLNDIETVSSSVSSMDKRIQQNAAMAEETTASSVRLLQEINSLKAMVDVFDLEMKHSKTKLKLVGQS